jgi:hypothetical protein
VLGGWLRLGFVLSLGLKNVQLPEGAVEGAIEVALIAGQQGEALVVIRQFLKNPGDAIFRR